MRPIPQVQQELAAQLQASKPAGADKQLEWNQEVEQMIAKLQSTHMALEDATSKTIMNLQTKVQSLRDDLQQQQKANNDNDNSDNQVVLNKADMT